MEFEACLDDVKKSIPSNGWQGYFDGQRDRILGNFQIMKKYLDFDDRILEVGSFPSYFLASLKRYGYDVEGIDLNPEREKDLS